jgi:hypothetical protein
MLAMGTFEEEKMNKTTVRVHRHGQGTKGKRKTSRSTKVGAV